MEGNTQAPNETKIAAAFHHGDAFLYFLMNSQPNPYNSSNYFGFFLKIYIQMP
jgi:hypothetical protein